MKKKRSVNLWILPLAFLLLLSCNKRPENVLSESETIDLIADLQYVEAYKSSPAGNNAVSRDQLLEGVLLAHGVTKEQYEATMEYYGKNIDEYAELYDKVEDRIRKKGQKYSGKDMTKEESLDNVWPYSPFAYINQKSAVNGFRFSLTPDNIEKGDRLEFSMRLTGGDGLDGLFGLEYSDGTSSYVKRSSSIDRKFSLPLVSDTSKTVSRIFGYLKVPESSMPLWIDSIQIIRLPFDSLEYAKVSAQSKSFRPVKKPELKLQSDTPGHQ